MACIKKLLPKEFVKSYAPSQDIPWMEVSLESDWLLRFKDPRVAEEFNVYKHRDLVFPFLMIFMGAGGWFFLTVPLPTPLIPVGGWDWASIVLIGSTFNGICGVVDYWAYLDLDAGAKPNGAEHGISIDPVSDLDQSATNKNSATKKNFRERLATIRWYLAFLANFFIFVEDIPGATWYMYDENCVQTPEWISYLGLRKAPLSYYSTDQIRASCSQVVSPFTTFVEVLILAATSVSTVSLAPAFIFDAVLRGLVEFRTRATPLLALDALVQSLFGITIVGCTLVMHLMRYLSSMNQFRQEIELRRATELSEKRQEEVDTLLCNLMPLSALDRLSKQEPVTDACGEASVLFSDMKGFTAWSSTRTAQQVVAMLNVTVLEIDLQATLHRVEKVKTIGDAYWAVAGLPDECLDHAERIVDFGNALLDVVSFQNEKHPEWDEISFRVGIHSGPLFGGILGSQQLSYEVFGETSTIATLAEQGGTPGCVVITEDTMRIIVEDLDGVDEQIWEDLWGRHVGVVEGSDAFMMTDGIRLYRLPRCTSVVTALITAAAHTTQTTSMSRKAHNNNPLVEGEEDSQTSKRSAEVSSRSTQQTGPRNRTGWTGDEAKAKRAEFLALQAAKTEGGSMLSGVQKNDTLESVTARYSKRKYKHLFYEFEDPVVEAKYIEDLAEKQRRLRIASRAGMIALLSMVLLSIGAINQGSFSLVSTIAFPVSGAILLIDFLICLLVSPESKLFAPKIQSGVQLAGICALLLGSGFMDLGESTATNDITYLGLGVSALLGFGNLGFVSWVTLCFMIFSVVTPLTLWLLWGAVPLTCHMFFVLFTAIVQAPVFIVTERLYRLQFLQHFVAEYFQAQQEERTFEQETLLSSIVPSHIVHELMKWMHTGMDPTKTIVHQLPVTATAFVQIDMKSHPSAEIPRVKADDNASNSSSTASNSQTESPLAAKPIGDGDMYVRRLSGDTGSPTPDLPDPDLAIVCSDGAASGGQEGVVGGENHWLQDIHISIDHILKSFKAVLKIKTMGDTLMMAGPFTPEYDLQTAADQLLAAVWAIHQITKVRAGLHCGELVGAVLGNSRLCFDIFGDTVNVASRTMTSGRTGDVSVSVPFVNSLPRGGLTSNVSDSKAWLSEKALFSEEAYEVPAKGKGTISLHRVLEF